MSMTGQGGPLPVLEVSGHGHSNRLGHRLAAFRPCEHMLGQPVPFEELVSVGDAFEDVAGVDRLKFEGAEALLQVFTKLFCGEIDADGAIALWPICEDVVYAFARRYEITELLELTEKLNLPIGWRGGFASDQEHSDGELNFTGAIINYVGRYERYLLLGRHDEFPGPARPPVAFGSWAFPYLDISLNLDPEVAAQLSEVMDGVCAGAVSLAEVTVVWPDWLRVAKAFTDSYEVDPARKLGALGTLYDPDQVRAAVLGPLEREYLAKLTLFLDMYREHREDASQEVFGFRDERGSEASELEPVDWGCGAEGDYSFVDGEAEEQSGGVGGGNLQRGVSELRRYARLAAWGFVDHAGIEERWPSFFDLADELTYEHGRWDLQDAREHLGAEPVTRASYLTGLLQLIDTIRARPGWDRGR